MYLTEITLYSIKISQDTFESMPKSILKKFENYKKLQKSTKMLPIAFNWKTIYHKVQE